MLNIINRSRRLPVLQQTSRYISTTLINREKHQFLVLAEDFTDDKALERRLSVRESHLVKARQSKIEKRILVGGAVVDNHENARMQGSFMLVSADSLEEAKKIVTSDIYYTAKVWEKFEIYPVKVAPLSKED